MVMVMVMERQGGVWDAEWLWVMDLTLGIWGEWGSGGGEVSGAVVEVEVEVGGLWCCGHCHHHIHPLRLPLGRHVGGLGVGVWMNFAE